MGAPASPQGGEKNFRRNLQGKCVSAPTGHEVHPQPEQESIFSTVFAGRVRFGGIFRRSLRATTEKRSSTFFGKKCTPDKILATHMMMTIDAPLGYAYVFYSAQRLDLFAWCVRLSRL